MWKSGVNFLLLLVSVINVQLYMLQVNVFLRSICFNLG